MSINKVTIEGNVMKNLELKGEQVGKQNTFFTVAVNRDYGSGSDFIQVKAFGDLATTCVGNLSKGSKVRVEGRLSSSSYEKDGKKHYTTTIIPDSVIKLGTVESPPMPQGTFQVLNEGDSVA